jgi:iron complex outermembrane receptor protein
MDMRCKILIGLFTTVSLSALANPAAAQNAVQPSAGAQVEAPGAPAADDPAAPVEGIAEIVVTAQRRAENLQRVGLAVSAVTGSDLTKAGITQPDDLGKLIPAVQMQPSAGSSVSIYLRGVGAQSGNAYAENAIAFNFGNVYIGRPTATVGTFFDLERVEVVKGPQGTLYGRNATGGAINVLPRRPSLSNFGGFLEGEYGNYDSKRVAAGVNLPLGDKAALRLAGQVVDRDGYLSDGTQDEVGRALRASFLVEPTRGWSALLIADYFRQRGKGQGSVLAPGSRFPAGTGGNTAPPLEDRIGASDPLSTAALSAYAATLGSPPFCGGFGNGVRSGCVITPRNDSFLDNEFWGVSATIEGDLGFGTLTIIPAYRRTNTNENGYIPGFQIRKTEETEQRSLEMRLTSNADQRLRYVLGGFLYKEEQNADNFFTLGLLSTNRFTPNLDTTSKAVFGQLTFDVSDKFRLIAGARYTNETKDAVTRNAAGALPGPVTPPLGAPFTGALEFEKVTWKAGVELDAGPRSLVYANVATGFKAGGFFTALPPANTFAPEELTAYTIGAKNRFFDNKLQLNFEAFYWDYKDQQITFVGGVPTNNGIQSGGITVNAGQATIYGVDIDLLFAPTSRDRFTANLQYLKGKYDTLVFDAFSGTGGTLRQGCAVTGSRLANPGVNAARLYTTDCSGQPTLNSPRWSAVAGYEHVFQLGGFDLTAGARTRIESSRWLGLSYLPEMRQGGYMMSDVYLTLENPNKTWSLTGFINNVEDETVLSNAGLKPIVDVVYVALRPPRTYGVRANFKF